MQVAERPAAHPGGVQPADVAVLGFSGSRGGSTDGSG